MPSDSDTLLCYSFQKPAAALHVVYRADHLCTRGAIQAQACRFLVEDGATVEQDEPFAEMEAMKQIMLMIAPARGTLHCAVPEGRSLSGGELVATLELEDPDAGYTGRPFTGGFPDLAEPQVVAEGLCNAFHATLQCVDMIMTGYVQDASSVVGELVDAVANPELPFAIWDDQWATLQAGLPAELLARLSDIVAGWRRTAPDYVADGVAGAESSAGDSSIDSTTMSSGEERMLRGGGSSGGVSEAEEGFPARQLRHEIAKHIERTPIKDQRIVESATSGVMAALQQLDGGPHGLACHTARDILDKFLTSEGPFLVHRELSEPDVIDILRKEHASDLQHVLFPRLMLHIAQHRSVSHLWTASPLHGKQFSERAMGIADECCPVM